MKVTFQLREGRAAPAELAAACCSPTVTLFVEREGGGTEERISVNTLARSSLWRPPALPGK